MKFSAIATLAAVASVDAKATAKETALWAVDGFKGFHDGFYKSFYKTKHQSVPDDCFDEATVDHMVTLGTIAMNPIHYMSSVTNVAGDISVFADATEVMENITKCRFEGPVVDLLQECSNDPVACSLPKIIENLTKNAFMLIGKLTSLTETFKGFPAADRDDFKEEMNEIGDDAGTFTRILFNFKKH